MTLVELLPLRSLPQRGDPGLELEFHVIFRNDLLRTILWRLGGLSG